MIKQQVEAALWAYSYRLALSYLGVMLVLWGLHAWFYEYDDTDPPGGRSGLIIRTDALTGCQYLTTTRGGLTPRVDRHGAPLCAQKDTP